MGPSPLPGHPPAPSAENDVDPVGQRSIFFRDGEPGLPAHDHHVLLPCDTQKVGSVDSGRLPSPPRAPAVTRQAHVESGPTCDNM